MWCYYENYTKHECISRIEKKLDEVTNNFHGELDYLKNELANISESRKLDCVEITRMPASLKSVSKDMANNVEVQNSIEKNLKKTYK